MRDLLRRLADDGWVLARQRGSHRQFTHPTKPGTVTVPGKPPDTLHPKTLRSISRQAGWEDDDGDGDEPAEPDGPSGPG